MFGLTKKLVLKYLIRLTVLGIGLGMVVTLIIHLGPAGIWGQVKSVRYSEVRLGADTGDLPSVQILAVMEYGEDTSCVWESRAFAKK